MRAIQDDKAGLDIDPVAVACAESAAKLRLIASLLGDLLSSVNGAEGRIFVSAVLDWWRAVQHRFGHLPDVPATAVAKRLGWFLCWLTRWPPSVHSC